MRACCLVLLIAALSAPAPARADEATSKLAEQLMALMRVDESMKQGMEMARAAMISQTRQMSASMGQTNVAQVADYQGRVMDLITSEMSWDRIKAQVVNLYATTFDESELKGLIEFYESPVGQAFIRKQPELMQKSMQLNQQLMRDIQPKLMQLMKESMPRAPAAPKR